MLALRLGDLTEAEARARELDSAEGSDWLRDLARRRAQSVRAHVAWARGDPFGALEALDRADPLGSRLPATFGWMSGGAVFTSVEGQDRFLRARALASRGQSEKALIWFRGLREGYATDYAYLPFAILESAHLQQSLGNRDEAIADYRRFVGLWRDCDPPLRAQVTRAESSLAELEAAGR